MKTKFLLPVLAMVFAVGMSFTTINEVGDPNQDYYLEDGVFMPLGTELNCGDGTNICKVQLEPEGPIYDVYHAADINTLKRGIGTVQKLY